MLDRLGNMGNSLVDVRIINWDWVGWWRDCVWKGLVGMRNVIVSEIGEMLRGWDLVGFNLNVV